MTWTNNFSKTFLIFASLIPFFRLIIPEKCFYQWILCHNFVYMKKFPWFLSFELGARQACDRRHRTMGTVHSGKISHLTWTFTKKYWAVLGCTGLYWAVLGHLRYLLGNVQVKWRILPLCSVGASIQFTHRHSSSSIVWTIELIDFAKSRWQLYRLQCPQPVYWQSDTWHIRTYFSQNCARLHLSIPRNCVFFITLVFLRW